MRVYICDHCGKVLKRAMAYYGVKGDMYDLCDECYKKLHDQAKRQQAKWGKFLERYVTAANTTENCGTDELLAQYVKNAIETGEVKF